MFERHGVDRLGELRNPVSNLTTVDQRLVPLNAFIGLCTPDHLWPAPLAEIGYRLVGLEVPVTANESRVVVDAVAFRQALNSALAAEAKSGQNVERDQARRYADVDVDDIIQASNITVTQPGERSGQALYTCLGENTDRILRGLASAGVEFPVLSIHTDRVEHHGAAFDDADVQRVFDEPLEFIGALPRYITVDQESPDDAYDTVVLAALVAELSHSQTVIEIPVLSARAIQHVPIYGTVARHRVEAKVDAAARRIAEADPDSFRYLPPTGTRPNAAVEFAREPEKADPRGRTQSYQAIARAGTQRRARRREVAGQATFDDLLEELDRMADANDEEATE